MGWAKRYWRAILAGVLFLGPPAAKGLQWLISLASGVDLIIVRIDDPRWIGVVIRSVLDPPGWAILPLILAGFVIIHIDIRRVRRCEPEVEREVRQRFAINQVESEDNGNKPAPSTIDPRSPRALRVRAVPYAELVAKRLKYASQVCSGEKDAERFYQKIVLQKVDMSNIIEWDTSALNDKQIVALERTRITHKELGDFVEYAKDNVANLTYEHIADLYSRRVRKLGAALVDLINELPGAASLANLASDTSRAPIEDSGSANEV